VQTEWFIRELERRFDKRGADGLHWRRHHQVWTAGQSSCQPAADHDKGKEPRITHGLLHWRKYLLHRWGQQVTVKVSVAGTLRRVVLRGARPPVGGLPPLVPKLNFWWEKLDILDYKVSDYMLVLCKELHICTYDWQNFLVAPWPHRPPKVYQLHVFMLLECFHANALKWF